MRLFVFAAVLVVILPACCMRNSTIKSGITGSESFEVKRMCSDSLRNVTSILFSDSMSAQIYIKEFSTSAVGDTISPVNNKIITINRVKRTAARSESESLLRRNSVVEGKEDYSAVYEKDLSSHFGSNLRIVLYLMVSVCVLVLLCVIKGRKG